jgi:hypothetical protein
MIPILSATRRWYCPNCIVEDETAASIPNRFHSCTGLYGLTAPLLPAGTKAKVELNERQDYIGTEQVRLVGGRPVMSVVTTRDDGQDCIVFAPTATATARME